MRYSAKIHGRLDCGTFQLLIALSMGIAAFAQTPAPRVTVGDGLAVQDQVPCILSQPKSYQMRGLTPPPGTDLATSIAQAVDKAARATNGSDPTATASLMALQSYSKNVRNLSGSSSSAVHGAVSQLQAEAVQSAIAANPTADPDAVKNAVANPTNQAIQAESITQPPKDVSCSMSILPWDETHKAFGRTVADTYLAIQIVVRNLNSDNEFLIHDAEFAVDANSAQLARFQVGHEKEIARGVLQYGQAYDRQHVFISVAQGVGTIMGAVVGLPQPAIDSLTGASGAYQAGLLPVLHTIFPDLTTTNLNALNDLGFSAANASRVVVPKSGSVPFVIFIPIRPLEQACWLQPTYDIHKDTSTPGLWTDACSQICTNTASCANQSLNEVRFKHWKPVHLQALEKHGYALIAGVHIKPTGQPATLKAFVCAAPTDTSGAYLQYALPASGLSCTLTGTDLDTLSLLRFRSPADKTTNLDAKVTVSGDNTTATALLSAADAAKIAQPTYELYAVDTSSKETDLNRSIAFRLPPTIEKNQNVAGAAGAGAALKGSNLAGISQVVFYDATDAKEVARADVSVPGTSTIGFAIPAGLTAGTTYTIRLLIADGANGGAGTVYPTKTTVKN
jgi:hypothetical protein